VGQWVRGGMRCCTVKAEHAGAAGLVSYITYKSVGSWLLGGYLHKRVSRAQ